MCQQWDSMNEAEGQNTCRFKNNIFGKCFIIFRHPKMFTEEDLKKLKKIKIDYQRKQSESNGSSAFDQKSEDELYISRYFLNDSFKILHIEIVGTEIVGTSAGRGQSYMIYIIKVLAEEFSYEVRRRYSQFLKLYQNVIKLENMQNKSQISIETERVDITKISKLDYTFPIKKLSSSLLHFFNMTNKQKLAQQRRSDLCAFLNQIKNNYYKFAQQFLEDYIQLLKFIDMKQEHQKYWRRKQGRFIQLSTIALKDSNLPNIGRQCQKKADAPVNVEYLSQLLQHQINKINLAIIAKQSIRKSSGSLRGDEEEALLQDPLVTDQIIKNVDCIKDVVLQLKRKINYDHIRCILKGKDIKEDTNFNMSASKKGLIEYSLKFTNNELVALHIIKTLVNVFMNSECNYSSEAFIKTLAEVDLAIFNLNQEKEILCLADKQFRESYFKLLRIYFIAKDQYGNNKKNNGQKWPTTKLMGLMLNSMFQNWIEGVNKNKQFKLKDQQRQWTMIIENQPKQYHTMRNPQMKQKNEQGSKNMEKQEKLIGVEGIQACKTGKVKQKNNIFHLTKQNEFIFAELATMKDEDFHEYIIKAKLKHLEYKQCVELVKNQLKWNPLLSRTQVDVYSHTRKDFIKIPGKQEKIFRFIERQEIQMHLQEDALQQDQLANFQHFIPLGNQQDTVEAKQNQKNAKMSTQTMPSASGSCAHQTFPEVQEVNQRQDLAVSQLSQQFILIKSPPKEAVINSYSQKVKVERLCNQKCQVEIHLRFSQPGVIKYFSSEVEGSTLFIWNGFCMAVEKYDESARSTLQMR